MKNFAHLHVHSYFSFQDGASSVEELSRSAAALGMSAMAIRVFRKIHKSC